MSRRCVRALVSPLWVLWVLLSFVAGEPAQDDHLAPPADGPSGFSFRKTAKGLATPPGEARPVKLPILALLDMSSGGHELEQFNGSSLLAVAEKAVAHVNALRLVPGFQLELVVNDSKVSVVSVRLETQGRPRSGTNFVLRRERGILAVPGGRAALTF